MRPIRKFERFGFLVLVILSIQVSYSQENYVPGYIIKPNNDKTTGYIDYRNWEKNPSVVRFKTTIDRKPTSFKPLDIVEFGTQDEIYVSGIVDTEITKLNTTQLDHSPKLRIQVDTTFLQSIFRGKKELYYYKNSNGRKNFYIQRDGKFDLLIYKKYFKFQDGQKIILKNNKYLGQLAFYLKDCPVIKSKIGNTSYSGTSISKLFKDYSQCSPSVISFQKKAEKIKIEIGVLIGGSSTSLTFTAPDFYTYLENTDYNQSTNFTAGLFFDLVFPGAQRKWSLNNEFLYTSYNFDGTYEDFRNATYSAITMTEIGYSYLKLNSLVRYKYPIGKAHVFLNAGISNGFVISETNYQKTVETFSGMERPSEGLAFITRKYEQGFILGAGMKFNKFSVEVRAEKGNGASKNVNIASKSNSYYFLLGYKF